jgi:hypothetical protein
MGYQQHDFDNEWEGLEPEQPQEERRWVWYAGIGMVLLFVAAICVGSIFVLTAQFRSRTTSEPGLNQPTPIGNVLEVAEEATAVTDTPPPVAPTATLGAPAPTNTSIPVSDGNVEANQVAAAPTINGDLSEWSGEATYQSAFRVYSASSWDGSQDLTAVWRLAWDDNNLYIGVTVIDDTHVQTQTGNQIFRGDSVDMQFDTNRDADFEARLSPDDFQITLSPGDFAGLPPAAFRFQGTTNGAILDAPGGHHVTVAAQRTDDGYTLEAAIPWSDLNLTPAPGLVIGLALNASDNDGPGTAVQEVMMSHVASRTLTDPTSWGTLTLK